MSVLAEPNRRIMMDCAGPVSSHERALPMHSDSKFEQIHIKTRTTAPGLAFQKCSRKSRISRVVKFGKDACCKASNARLTRAAQSAESGELPRARDQFAMIVQV